MVTTHEPVPVQAPDQLENSYPLAGEAVTVTDAPEMWVVVPEGDTVPPLGGLALVVRSNC